MSFLLGGALWAMTVFPAVQESADGTWTNSPNPWPLFPVHLALMPDRSLLILNRSRRAPEFPVAHSTLFSPGRSYPPYTNASLIPFWDPQEHTPHEIFCAGHTLLPDGRTFFAGGHLGNDIGTFDTHTFDPVTGVFALRKEMLDRRWYPSVVVLPNQRVLILSGTRDDNLGERRNPIVELWMDGVGPDHNDDYIVDLPPAYHFVDRYYPQGYVDPTDGHLFVPGSGIPEDNSTGDFIAPRNQKLNLFNWQWTDHMLLQPEIQNVRKDYCSGVMIDGLIIRSGGSRDGDDASPAFHATSQVIYANLYDFDPLSAWKKAPSLQLARKQHTLVALPDGQVLAMGGCLYGQNGQVGGPTTNDWTDNERSAPEIWNPETPDKPWRLLATPVPNTGRGYHSVALLLPDARIIVGGGESEYQIPVNGQGRIVQQKRTPQFFSPPYGGRDNWEETRPRILRQTGEPVVMRYGESLPFFIRTSAGRTIKKLTLISLGSTTHAFNGNQTVVFLNKTSLPSPSGVIIVDPPAAPRIARPGFYMLFAVDSEGIPSEAVIVQLKDWDQVVSHKAVVIKGTAGSLPQPSELYAGDERFLGKAINSVSGTIEVRSEGKANGMDFAGIRVKVECRTSEPTTLTVSAQNVNTKTWTIIGQTQAVTWQNEYEFEWLPSEGSLMPFVSQDSGKVNIRARWLRTSDFRLDLDLLEVGLKPVK